MFRVEAHGERVAILRMDDGKVNAIGPAFVAAFPGAWAEAAQGGRAVVMAGNAKAFCAGLDLRQLPALGASGMGRFTRDFMASFLQVLEHPRPVVAAWEGAALAGGAIFGLCADFRVASTRARVGVTEVPVGIPFPDPVVDLVRETLPAHEHAPALLQGIVREGAALREHGWAHHVVAPEETLPRALALAEELAAHEPAAYAATKRIWRAPVYASFERFAKDGPERWAAQVMEPRTLEGILASFERMTRK